MSEPKKRLRAIDPPFVAAGPAGVAIRDRLKYLTPEDVQPAGGVPAGCHVANSSTSWVTRNAQSGGAGPPSVVSVGVRARVSAWPPEPSRRS